MSRALRTAYGDPWELVEYIERTGGPPLDQRRWRPWILDNALLQLRHRTLGCVIDLRDACTPRAALTQVADVARSTWSSEHDVATLLLALDELLCTPRHSTSPDDLPDLVARAVARRTDTDWRTTT